MEDDPKPFLKGIPFALREIVHLKALTNTNAVALIFLIRSAGLLHDPGVGVNPKPFLKGIPFALRENFHLKGFTSDLAGCNKDVCYRGLFHDPGVGEIPSLF